MMDTYILDENGEPVAEPDLTKWAQWNEQNRGIRRVARDEVGEVLVSTVFLTLDHRFGEGPPILWETMTFRHHKADDYGETECERCSGSREQAEAMHARIVEKLRANLSPTPTKPNKETDNQKLP